MMDNFVSKLENYGLDKQTAEQIKHSLEDLSWRIIVDKSFSTQWSPKTGGISLYKQYEKGNNVYTHRFQMTPNWEARGKEKEGNQLILSMARLLCRGT